MAANTQGMDSHGNSKLPAKAAEEGSLAPSKEAVVEHMYNKNPVAISNLNGMNSHGDTVIPEMAAEANIDRHMHGLHPQSSKE
jgi:LDH2 family malate/lactate/ureidoglycolate dehydrogenase